jgi:hypothetical protein
MFSSSTVMSSRRRSLSTATMNAPSAAMIAAVARPMPLAQAVISATLSLNRMLASRSISD